MTDLKEWANTEMERLIAEAIDKGYCYNISIKTLEAWNAMTDVFEKKI